MGRGTESGFQRQYYAMRARGLPVCPEWLGRGGRGAFLAWCEQNAYPCGEPLVLDAYLLSGGEPRYSPESCCLLPKRAKAMIGRAPKGALGLPNGISISSTGGYLVHYHDGDIPTTRRFRRLADAESFNARVRAKLVRQLTEGCAGAMPARVREAILAYDGR